MLPAAYQVLARKYRPVTFADLKGQDALVRTLTNAIASNRIAHAFLLTGIRGVGKTTTARIIARSLNCVGIDGTGGPTIAPCGECVHCVAIREDRHPDILEMDAASRTGVDSMREIIENSRYLPTMSRFKIYIIDEVHMLSTNAFNALLKTLEEPPPHVKFILATTETRKIPVTIISRCQRFDLRRLSSEALISHLSDIAGRESAAVESDALALLAEAAEGSVRDGLSLLDRAIAHRNGEIDQQDNVVTLASVEDMLGLADKSALFDMIDAVISGNMQSALQQFRDLYHSGADALLILEDLLALTHKITMFRVTAELAGSSSGPEEERLRAGAIASQLSIAQLTRMWQMLLKGLQETRLAPDTLAAAEMVIIRLGYASQLPVPAALIKELTQGGSTPSSQVTLSQPISPIAAPVIVTQAATPVATATSYSSPASFNELVAMAKDKKEMLLYHTLMGEVSLVHFEQGKIELALLPGINSDIKSKLNKCLMEWTGNNWIVMISQESATPTLEQQKQQQDDQLKMDLSGHPVVKAVLDQFSGSEIKDVYPYQPSE